MTLTPITVGWKPTATIVVSLRDWRKSANDGFAAAGNAVAGSAAMRAAGFVHLRNEAGFD
jgi:hypothetical protein